MKKYILAIESSCDDTSVAYLTVSSNEPIIIDAQKTVSQIDIHKVFGGVIPEVAGRKHAEAIVPLIQEILEGRKIKEEKLKASAQANPAE